MISKENIEICSMIDQKKIINEMNLKTTLKLMEILWNLQLRRLKVLSKFRWPVRRFLRMIKITSQQQLHAWTFDELVSNMVCQSDVVYSDMWMVQIVRTWLDITSPIWERIMIEWFDHNFAGMKRSFERDAVTLFAELGVVFDENVCYSNLISHGVNELLTGLRVVQFRC